MYKHDSFENLLQLSDRSVARQIKLDAEQVEINENRLRHRTSDLRNEASVILEQDLENQAAEILGLDLPNTPLTTSARDRRRLEMSQRIRQGSLDSIKARLNRQ